MMVQQADILIKGGQVVTADAEHRILSDGAVAISGTDIVAVGPTAYFEDDYAAGEVIDASGYVVMPGLINGHTHLGDSLFRSLVGDIQLEKWLETLWTAEREFVKPDAVRLGTQLAIAESIRGGTTAALDMFWFPEEGAKAAKEAGFRLISGPVYLDFGAYQEVSPQMAEDFLEEYKDDPLIVPAIQPHGTYTVGPQQLTATFQLAQEYGALYHIHASETQVEVATVREKYGRTPIEQLEEYNLLTDKTVLAHAVHLNEEEIALVAERGSIVAHCPVCNCKLGSGIAPVPDMIDAGVKVVLGTDGPVSSNDLDLWTHMRFAATLHRGVRSNPLIMTAPEIIHMVTRNAAEAFGIGFTGSLEAGKRADVIMINMQQPHLAPVFDLYSYLVYAVGRADVETVIINGQVVMRNRELLTLDEEKILAEINTLAPEIAAFVAAQKS